jgi:hypothetical protein
MKTVFNIAIFGSLYFSLSAPVLFIVKVFNLDILNIKIKPEAESYWIKSAVNKNDIEVFRSQYKI